MPATMAMLERLCAVGTTLPPAAQAELLDFAEFLHNKSRATSPSGYLSLQALAGGLEQSENFAEPPLVIQEHLRHEWD